MQMSKVPIISGYGVLDTTLCDKVCHLLSEGQWLSLVSPVYSANKTDRHDITVILLKVALNTITLTLNLLDSTLGVVLA